MKINISLGLATQQVPILWKDGGLFLSHEFAKSGRFYHPDFSIICVNNLSCKRAESFEFSFSEDIKVESFSTAPRAYFEIPERDLSKWQGMGKTAKEQRKKAIERNQNRYNEELKSKMWGK